MTRHTAVRAVAVAALVMPLVAPAAGLDIELYYETLDNGLKVVLAPEHTAPTAAVAVYYGIGFRSEPKGRTGFAHLFEHMFFEGTEALERGQLVQLIAGNGGLVNAVTRTDFTAYTATAPTHVLDSILWAEADRMRGLRITKTNLKRQKSIVINEIGTNVLNRPYGGFAWLDLPQAAFSNWYNAHNFYGDIHDIEAATAREARRFYTRYYVPNNAVIVVAGDIDPERVFKRVRKHFGGIRRGPVREPIDISEDAAEAERRVERTDVQVPRAAIAVGYRMPERGTDAYYAMGLIDQLLLQGEDSRLAARLVRKRGYTDRVSGGINVLGNMFNYSGPMLWTLSTIHDGDPTSRDVLAEIDSIIEEFSNEPVSNSELEVARTKIRSTLYDTIGTSTRWGLVDLLAVFALFDDDPESINKIDTKFAEVSAETVLETARTVLRPENRTVLTLVPADSSR